MIRIKNIDLPALAGAIVLTLFGCYVFYGALYGIIPASVVGIYGYKVIHRGSLQRRKLRRLDELRNVMISVQTSLEAGKSLENALVFAEKDLSEIYGVGNEMVNALGMVKKKISLNYTTDLALAEFAKEVDLTECYDFVDVISTIKKTGGNAVKIIKDAVERIVNEMELREELGTMVAAKKYELMIMVCMPSLITLFLRLTNGDYLKPLYGNISGAVIMTLMLFFNIAAYYLGRKIVDIY